MTFRKRQAVNKEQVCGECNKIIKLKEFYLDTGIKIGKKPWDTKKICLSCGDKTIESSKAEK